jgi:hypothetical protein
MAKRHINRMECSMKMGHIAICIVQVLLVVRLLLATIQCAAETTQAPFQPDKQQQQQAEIQHNRDFGVSSYIFSGEWDGRPYQATLHARPVCQDRSKHVRMVISIATAPHPYYQYQRSYEHSVTPAGWFKFGKDGMPKIWFQDYTTGERADVWQHVGEREVDGEWFLTMNGYHSVGWVRPT